MKKVILLVCALMLILSVGAQASESWLNNYAKNVGAKVRNVEISKKQAGVGVVAGVSIKGPVRSTLKSTELIATCKFIKTSAGKIAAKKQPKAIIFNLNTECSRVKKVN